MDVFGQIDLFATKGIEYLLVIGYLLLLVPFWLLINRKRARNPQAVQAEPAPSLSRSWFSIPDGVYFHPGHAWAQPRLGGVFRVGLDDFAQRLIGDLSGLVLPEVGTDITAGDIGWQIEASGKRLPMLAPVTGTVVSINRHASDDPELVNRDPFGDGWLLEVRLPRPKPALRTLLSGRSAEAWMDTAVQKLQNLMGGRLGLTLPDGGVPVPGFASQLSPHDWEQIGAQFFLTD